MLYCIVLYIMKGLIKLAVFLRKNMANFNQISQIFAQKNMANFFPIWLKENFQFSQFG